MHHYSFKTYDPVFPQLFLEEKSRILEAISGKIKIEHIGSTAVSGLGGKGVIDFYIMADKDKLPVISRKLQDLGYEFKPDAGKPPLWLFHDASRRDKNGIMRHYHAHLVWEKESGIRETIAFRNYLRRNPEALREYAEIKRAGAQKVEGVADHKLAGEIYQGTKNDIIRKIVNKALAEDDC